MWSLRWQICLMQLTADDMLQKNINLKDAIIKTVQNVKWQKRHKIRPTVAVINLFLNSTFIFSASFELVELDLTRISPLAASKLWTPVSGSWEISTEEGPFLLFLMVLALFLYGFGPHNFSSAGFLQGVAFSICLLQFCSTELWTPGEITQRAEEQHGTEKTVNLQFSPQQKYLSKTVMNPINMCSHIFSFQLMFFTLDFLPSSLVSKDLASNFYVSFLSFI